jgi:DNA (cytosine-5)-methyltransferase 1
MERQWSDIMLTFIDLFAGIGGTRIAFEKAGCKCVFSSEWDRFAQITYEKNFGKKPAGDIRKIESSQIPDHDILVAGFPCQPFSISGVSKKNSLGKPHGFNDPTQGTLFFEIKRILIDKNPKAFLLENVKNLKSHNKKNTFKVIMDTLENELGYNVYFKVLDAVNYVPQHRERIFIVGFKENLEFKFPDFKPKRKPRFEDILEKNVDAKYTLSDHLWKYLQDYARKHKEKGNGFGFGLTNLKGHSRTLSARYYKDGSEILIPQNGKNPRRLTPRECARLMGFPDSFVIPVSDTQAYKQFGNSVVVPLVMDIAIEMIKAIGK